MKSKRIQEIQDYVLRHQTVSLDELVEIFGVSKNTIRRDIQWLAERGEIKKVYGGVAANRSILVSFTDRQTQHQSEKKLIAKEAAQFVKDDDIIFIDSGTTTLEMFEFLKQMNITVITNNLTFIVNSAPYENLTIISIGGVLVRKTNSYASLKETHLLKTYNIDKAFMASTGISLLNGVTNSSPLETELKETAVARSSQVFLLVDHYKFNQHGLVTYCQLDEIDYLVSDQIPDESYQKYAKENNVKIVVPK